MRIATAKKCRSWHGYHDRNQEILYLFNWLWLPLSSSVLYTFHLGFSKNPHPNSRIHTLQPHSIFQSIDNTTCSVKRDSYELTNMFSTGVALCWWSPHQPYGCGLQPLRCSLWYMKTLESSNISHSFVRTHCTRICRTFSQDIITIETCSCARRVGFKLTKSSEPALSTFRPRS
jgi:hypothetical protein